MATQVHFDCEFGFANGDRLALTAVKDRDSIAADDLRFKFTLRPSDVEVEEVTVHRDHLNYSRITQRTLEVVEPTVQ